MLETRRRRLAWLFALVLLAELALLCCACVRVESHVCPGHGCCAVCALLDATRFAAALVVAALCLMASPSFRARFSRRERFPFEMPISRRVRLND